MQVLALKEHGIKNFFIIFMVQCFQVSLMKFKALVILTICGALCDCKKEENYKDYEHYDLKDKEKIVFKYMEEDGTLQEYAMSDITEGEPIMAYHEGLFYKLNDSDYILLDSLYNNIDPSYAYKGQTKQYTYFYDNKIYVKRSFIGLLLIEYTLNKEKTEKKEISFDVSKIVNSDWHLYCKDIRNIEKNTIIFDECSVRDEDTIYDNQTFELKCSLEDYKCEENL